MTTNNTSNDTNYYNLHLEGFANIYDIRMVNPKAGQNFKPFMRVRAAFLQGRADNAEPVFVDLNPTGKKAIAIMERFQEEINNKDIKVSGAIKVGDIRMEASVKNGSEARVFTSARLLAVKYLALKSFDENNKQVKDVIDLSQFDEPTGENSQNHEPSAVPAKTPAIIPDAVTLDTEADDYDQRVAELTAAGYTFNQGQDAWIAPQGNTIEGQFTDESDQGVKLDRVIKLDRNDPDFEGRKAELKARGYRWNRDLSSWVLPEAA